MEGAQILLIGHFSLIDFIWRHVWRHKFCHICNKYWPFQLTTNWLNMWTTVMWRRQRAKIDDIEFSRIKALERLHVTVVDILSQLGVDLKGQCLIHMWQNLWRHTWSQMKFIIEKWRREKIWVSSIFRW